MELLYSKPDNSCLNIVMEINFENAVKVLTSQGKFYISLGLERISKILEILGNPHDKLKYIHVAGTNGKGSTSAMLSTIFTCAGYKTGLFTSPHILDYTERIRIDNKKITKDEFADLIFRVCKTADDNQIHLTEFEILTAAMFVYFADHNVEIVVLETGLGGRFDATNVIKKNLLSVITSVSFDHTDRLGDTIEKIAYEKAGIIKSGCPVIVSEKNAGFEVIKAQADLKNSPLLTTKTEVKTVFEKPGNYAVFDGKKYEFGLLGTYQKENLELVLETVNFLRNDIKISELNLQTALKKVRWSCRLQYLTERNLIIDGAHNPDGARRLRESLDIYFPNQKITWIYGTLKNKDYKTVVKTLFREGDEVYLYEFRHPNCANYEQIAACTTLHVQHASNAQIQNMLGSTNLKVAAGSIYMLSEIINSSATLKNIALVDNIY